MKNSIEQINCDPKLKMCLNFVITILHYDVLLEIKQDQLYHFHSSPVPQQSLKTNRQLQQFLYVPGVVIGQKCCKRFALILFCNHFSFFLKSCYADQNILYIINFFWKRLMEENTHEGVLSWWLRVCMREPVKRKTNLKVGQN